jgi:hypothetical protein
VLDGHACDPLAGGVVGTLATLGGDVAGPAARFDGSAAPAVRTLAVVGLLLGAELSLDGALGHERAW